MSVPFYEILHLDSVYCLNESVTMTIVYLDRQKIVGISVLAAIVTFVAGILIGYFGIRSNPETLSRRLSH